jgi:hypothetical protein
VRRTADLIFEIQALLLQHVFFKERRYALLIAVWVVGTYVYDLFTFYGYLWLNSPEKRCGKSLLMDVLEKVASNATPRLNNASEAAIFRIAARKHTMLLDEVENMRGQDREKYAAILTLLNAGFSAGARVPRCEKVEGEFVITYFDCYCPKILAGIARVVDTIEDRCFKISMVRKAPSEHVERFNVRRQGGALADLRRQLSIWADARRSDISAVYDELDNVAGLERLDDRFRDISEPLAAIAIIADVELANGSRRVWPDLCALFRVMAGRRDDAETNAAIAAMVELCAEILGDQVEIFEPSADLFRKASETEGLSWIKSMKALASFLNKFDMIARQKSGGKVRGYLITREWLEDTKSRYVSSIYAFEVSHTSQTRAQSGSGGIL